MAPKTKKKAAAEEAERSPRHDTECSSIVKLTAAWVVPVKVEELGAHLEAYYDTVPICTTFKLCVKNSQGNMSKLPLELVDQILDLVMQEKCEECMDMWAARYWNSTGINKKHSLDYIKSIILRTPKNKAAVRKLIRTFTKTCEICLDIKRDVTPPAYKCSYCEDCLELGNPTAWRDHAYVDDLTAFLETQDLWSDACDEEAMDWHNEIIEGVLFPDDWMIMLRKHFGMDIWLGIQQDGPKTPTYETTALLIPARHKTVHSHAEMYVGENDITTWDASQCMAIEDILQLDDAHKGAFQRTVRKLKLTPHSMLERQSNIEDDGTANAKWPRLAALANAAHSRSHVHCY